MPFKKTEPDISDINECQNLNGGCSQVCVNRVGSFQCRCRDGYTLNVDNRTCDGRREGGRGRGRGKGWREEAGREDSQECMNRVGSFQCHCRDGYTLNVDNRTCDGRREGGRGGRMGEGGRRQGGREGEGGRRGDGMYRCIIV